MTPETVGYWQGQGKPSWKQLQPGIYDTGDGKLHIDVTLILIDRDIEPTPEVIEIAARNLVAAMAGLGYEVEVVE